MIEEFPLLEKTTYLNTAYVGLMSKGLLDYRRQVDQDYLFQGDMYKEKQQEVLQRCHGTLAQFLGASAHNVFFVPNFSSGFRFVLDTLPKSSSFLLLKEDYPSLTKTVVSKGFDVTTIPITATLERSIEAAMEEQKRDVLALSIIQYNSGLMIDSMFLHRLKLKYPDLLIIADGTQFIGAELFHFDNAPFDVVIASGYKWLLAGFGNGFMAISNRFFQKTTTTKEMMYNNVFTGHFNYLGVSSLTFAVNRLLDWSFPELIQRKEVLSNLLKDALFGIGLLDPILEKRSHHSSIFSIHGNQHFFDDLCANNIRCKQRGGKIRISLHFYNSEKDIEKLVEFLQKNRFF